MEKVKTQRIPLGTFDFIRGVAMLWVIVLHSVGVYNTEQSVVLTSVANVMDFMRNAIVPLFFIISGFGFKPKKPKAMLKKTFMDLIIPYLWVVAAYATIYPVVLYLTSGSIRWMVTKSLSYIVSLLLGNTADRTLFGILMPWWLPCWFLLATFTSFNALNLILKLKKAEHQILGAVLSVAVGYGLFCLDFHYYCVAQGLMAVGYCYLGYALKKFNLLERIRTCVWAYVILLPITIAESVWGFFDLCPGVFNHVVLDYIGAGCSALLMLLVGVWLGKFEWKVFDWIKTIGIYTHWIICIHAFEENGLPWWLLIDGLAEHQLLAFVIEMIIKVVFMTSVCMMIKKIAKYRYQRKKMLNV